MSNLPMVDSNIFEVSPLANLIAAQIGTFIFIKVLNQVDCEQSSQNLKYQQRIAFLPIYLDEDYNFLANRKRHSLEQKTKILKEIETQEKHKSVNRLTQDKVEATIKAIKSVKNQNNFSSIY